jgi:hypothetical protein
LYESFSDNKRVITSFDITQSIKESVPISKLMREEIDLLRAWASERARNASNGVSDLKRYNVEEDDL